MQIPAGLSYADLEHYRNRHLQEVVRWRRAISAVYSSTSPNAAVIHAAVDQTPRAVIDSITTMAVLLAMNYGDEDVRAIVIAKMVEDRLAS